MILFVELSKHLECMVNLDSGNLCISCTGQADEYIISIYSPKKPTELEHNVTAITQSGPCFMEQDHLEDYFIVFARNGGKMDRYPALIYSLGESKFACCVKR